MKHSNWLRSVVLFWLVCTPLCHGEDVFFNGKDFKGGYFHVPDNLPKDGSKVWVMVHVHGAGGLRGGGSGQELAKLMAPEPVIVIVPSFEDGYQAGDGAYANKLIGHFQTVQKAHAVHDKMFVHGHSGGGQFAHRFAFSSSKYVIGISAHSSGSWACSGGYGSISNDAKGIPFAISCGEKDNAYSVKGAPHTRIEWYHLFAAEMEKKGFVFIGQTWPEAGHGVPMSLYGSALKECFLLATRGEMPTSGLWKGDLEKISAPAKRALGTGSTKNSPSSKQGKEPDMKTLREANDRIAKGQLPDPEATMRFLARHPAASWADDSALADLKAHCKKSAMTYLQERKSSGKPLSETDVQSFREATEGLEIED